MILGMSGSRFTTLHVIISLLGIAAAAIVLIDMLGGTGHAVWTAFFV